MFIVTLDQFVTEPTVVEVEADQFVEGEHGITFSVFTSRHGSTGYFPVEWYPSAQVISIRWETPDP